jgi:hypothetical protein
LSIHLRLGLPSGLFSSGFPTKRLTLQKYKNIMASRDKQRKRNSSKFVTFRYEAYREPVSPIGLKGVAITVM